MNSPAHDVVQMLAADSGLALTETVDLFASRLPASPDFCVAVYDYAGEEKLHGLDYWRPRVQVKVRGDIDGYAAAYAVAEGIRDVLDAVGMLEFNGAYYVGIWSLHDPAALPYDDKGRPILVMNFKIHRQTI